MLSASTILLIAFLLGIVIHDFKHRLIPLYLLIASLLISALRIAFMDAPLRVIHNTGINMLGTLMILGLSIVILFIVKQQLFNPLNTLIGTGDLLFFPVLCASLSPINYLLFFVCTGLAIILYKILKRQSASHIPLAGMQAVFLIVLLGSAEFSEYNIMNDSFILQILY